MENMQKIRSDNLKLTFIKRLREKFVDGLDSLKGSSEDDYKDGQLGRHDFKSFQDEIDSSIYSLCIPFCDVLDKALDFEFGRPENEPFFPWVKDRILELNKFVMDLFEPASQMFEEAVTNKNFDDVIRRFDDLIFENLEKEEVKL